MKMKLGWKIVALAMALVFFSVQSAMAITWVTANQATVQWDAVTADVDGDPIPAGTHVEYKVWLANKLTDPNKSNPVELTQTTATEFTITLNTKGQYVIGVNAIHIEDNTSLELAVSDFAWSDNPDNCADTDGDGVGNDFGIRFFAALPTTKLSPKPAP
ncbi:MAG: hypothetical protein ACWGQW_02890 [bacterium]